MFCPGINRKRDCSRTVSAMVFVLFISAWSLPVFSQDKSSAGRLAGTVRDENSQPLAGVSIAVENGKKGTTTSVSGDYLLILTPGTYIIFFSAVNYAPQRITDVVIKSNELTDLSLTLAGSKKDTLQNVTITSTARKASVAALLHAQKNAADMRDGISNEQLARLPVSNVAQALARVSGISIQSDKFVTVRGVSDRYNNAMINGSMLPSTEPNRRNFSFDIIPSALVDNVTVNKTATPDLPGEFTGGMVQISTKDVPAKSFLEISLGTGINSESFDRIYTSFKRDKRADLGIIDKERKWFRDGGALDPENYFAANNAGDTAYMRKAGSQVPTRWQRYRYNYMPSQNYQLSGGISKHFNKGNSFGLIAALTYLNEALYEEGPARSVSVYSVYNTRTRYTTTLGGLMNATYKTARHKLSWKNLFNHRYSLQSDQAYGFIANQSENQYRFSDVVFAGTLMQTRLEGEHLLFKKVLKAEWFADYINYNRDQPDSRYLVAREDSATKTLYFRFTDPLLSWGGLYSSLYKESRNNAGLNLSFPFIIKNQRQLIKIGYAYSRRNVDYDAIGLRILDGNTAFGSNSKGLPYYEIIKPERIRNGDLVLYPAPVKYGTGDRYDGLQELHSMYAMADIRFLAKWRLIGGVRNENNRMDLTTSFFNVINTAPYLEVIDSTASYPEKDWLPSVNIIYSFNSKMNLRGAFSKTVARADFVERSKFRYYDFAEQLEVFGDQQLVITRIKNYDLRYEFYPSQGEIISASLFYKYFDKPVERFFELSNPSNTVEYRNVYSAIARGFELDLRKNLGFINQSSSFLKNLVFSGNFTYLKGDLTIAVTRKNQNIPIDDTFYLVERKRPIQNLTPYIINVGLAYQVENWGLNLAFNRSGRKIINGGIDDVIIQYENPRSILDFQFNARLFRKKIEMRFNASNLLNSPFIIYANHINTGNMGVGSGSPNNDPKRQGFNENLDFINYKVKKGVGLSVKAVYRF